MKRLLYSTLQWIFNRFEHLKIVSALLIFLAGMFGAIGAQDLYEYFFTDPTAITISVVQDYAINEIFIKKVNQGWESYVYGIYIVNGQPSPNPSLKDGTVKELVAFSGQSIEEVYSKAKYWIALAR